MKFYIGTDFFLSKYFYCVIEKNIRLLQAAAVGNDVAEENKRN